MRIGYARVSTVEQNLDLQIDALTAAGCERTVTDKASGSNLDRPGLEKLLQDVLRDGDVLVVWRLDRLARSLKQLIELVEHLSARGIHLVSLQENIDTNSAGGRLVCHLFGSLAEFERCLIQQRTLSGLEAARARGRKGGRPKALDAKNAALARQLYAEKKLTVAEICKVVGVSKPTLYRYVQADWPESR